MGKLIVRGGNKLAGEVDVSGAKNSVLPILAATVLNGGMNVIHNIPNLSDVSIMIKILVAVGCSVKKEGSTVIVDSSGLNNYEIPEYLVREMRSSIIVLGSMLARCGQVRISYPGGCELGPRPIDLHLKALREMGAVIKEEHGFLICDAKKMKGTEIQLDFPSVGATENIMLAAVFAEGTTTIRNAAREPEIRDLQNFINRVGGKVTGAGSATIRIEGVKKLKDVEHQIIPDRIVAGTFLAAAAITKGEIVLNNVIPEHLQSILFKLKEAGCTISIYKNSIRLNAPNKIKAIESIKTMPYPGFPTDMQSQILSLMALSDGITIFTENIFENRYKHAYELTRMGANIKIDGRVAIVKGVDKLSGATVAAHDLRGGAALIIAGLAAEGTTLIENTHHIDRGYDNIDGLLVKLGADIKKQ
ncbi:UDP-N-acetylglucosamine 1-carboxyvinyltransferase [Serpentinicella alkaliphila]|uniref:UDP-N-acetylglucosamine 1-carboxyvinyltransferase n=1 Tax=Serpentinicella alkaliphila TaxID=1734049 RepID=A0A4R2UCJ9_9FIRM|nr:UDP-N-acetylglucosamine 1-carboxyvinyltransferase [Serpentinicella alkaliphila]QUH26769.1 UDP-N-acetylglucosamine 1-carboxyvinyltransferase [Serpentinicella alkaliphila]TCQ07989.1 UDP-N-acetylglucosamine 1-carboxyvinyltransferase [Serpentinicella alkaliphila]